MHYELDVFPLVDSEQQHRPLICPGSGALSMIEATIGAQPPLKFWELTVRSQAADFIPTAQDKSDNSLRCDQSAEELLPSRDSPEKSARTGHGPGDLPTPCCPCCRPAIG